MKQTARGIEAIREQFRPWYLRNIYFRAFPSRKPQYFEDCWRFDHLPVNESARLFALPSPEAFTFLIYPMSDWHARIQRSQFFAKSLAALGHRCVILNPHLGREFPGMGGESAVLARLDQNIFELHVRLPDEPVYHHRNLRESESEMLTGAVSQLIDAGHLANLIQLVSLPVWLGLAQRIRKRFRAPIVCDCHDRLAGFNNVAQEIVAEEPALIAASDLVICSADRLRSHCLELGAQPNACHVVRNAVSGPVAAASPRNSPGPATSPVIGYLGALEDWFDCDAIAAAAAARPDWRFVLAGRVESRNLSRLSNLPNVEAIGEVSRDRVPDILAGFDVATIPFQLNPLTLGADPIKLYEYLAAGLPIVSARLPETERFSSYVHYYDAPQNFIDAIQSALEDRSEARRAERFNAVRHETWESRCRQILGLLPPPLV